MKIFAVSVGAQNKLINKYCFQTCGEIGVGAIEIEGGMFLPCHSSKCLHEEKRMKLDGTLKDKDIWIRKLK